MSHFTVLVHIPADEVSDGDVLPALESMLAPYQENNGGDCPKEYLEFNDVEDEYLKEYENDSTEMVRLPDGELVFEWDERFRVKGTIGTGSGTHKVPESYQVVPVPHKERYASFDEFMNEWAGFKGRDKKTGRYGYWENPNRKWDWWQLGGRWNGKLPVKPGASNVANGTPSLLDRSPEYKTNHVDACRIGDLDLDEIAKQTREEAEKFWDKYQLWRSKDYDPNSEEHRWLEYDVRDTCVSLGLVSCKDKAELTDDDKDVERWGDRPNCREGAEDRYDVFRPLTKDEFMAECMEYFSPVTTYAALDKEGWHAPGEMGWFGCSSAEPENKLAFLKEFYKRFIKSSDKGDWIAIVDCHI